MGICSHTLLRRQQSSERCAQQCVTSQKLRVRPLKRHCAVGIERDDARVVGDDACAGNGDAVDLADLTKRVVALVEVTGDVDQLGVRGPVVEGLPLRIRYHAGEVVVDLKRPRDSVLVASAVDLKQPLTAILRRSDAD